MLSLSHFRFLAAANFSPLNGVNFESNDVLGTDATNGILLKNSKKKRTTPFDDYLHTEFDWTETFTNTNWKWVPIFTQTKNSLNVNSSPNQIHFNLLVASCAMQQTVSPSSMLQLERNCIVECMSLGRKYELPSYFRTIEWHCCDNGRIYDKHSQCILRQP